MERIARFIVRFRYLFLLITCTFLIISLILLPFVKTNYDMTKYLPNDMNTKKSLEVMEEEFGEMGQAMIMVENITIKDALTLKKTLFDQTEGILNILWLDTFVDPEILLQLDSLMLEVAQNSPDLAHYLKDLPGLNQFYKNDKALFQVVFKHSDYSDVTDQAITSMRRILDAGSYNYAMSGSAFSTYNARHATENEIFKISIFVLPIFIIILVIFTSSFLEPLLFLVVVGVAVLINMGTNFFLGEVSFFTQSTAVLLQFAVSMDYAIFLLHRYQEEKRKIRGKNKQIALIRALKNSISSILSSACTTIAGFVALIFMRYTIGADMAIVMIKGVVLSLLSVFVFMPVLILICDKWIERTKHRNLAPKLNWITSKAFQWRFIVPIILIFLIFPAFNFQNKNEFIYGNSAMESSDKTQSALEMKRISDEFGNSNIIVLLLPHVKKVDLSIDEEATKLAENRLIDNILTGLDILNASQNYNIQASIQSYYRMTDLKTYIPFELPEGPEMEVIKDQIRTWLVNNGYGDPKDWIKTNIPEEMKAQLVSPNYSRVIISINTTSESKAANAAVNVIRSKANDLFYNKYYLLGLTSSVQEIQQVVESDFVIVNFISIVAVLVIIMLTFKSFILPFILVFVIELSIWLNMSVPYLMGEPLIFIGYMLVSSIQLGATIDYAILLTTRYLENRKQLNKKKSMIKSIYDSGNSILTSALIMGAAGFTLSLSSSIEGVSSIGSLIGRGAILSAVLVLIFLPQLLYFFDQTIFKSTIGLNFIDSNGKDKPKDEVVLSEPNRKTNDETEDFEEEQKEEKVS